VRLGAHTVVQIVAGLFAATYALAAVHWMVMGRPLLAITHVLLGAALVSKVVHTTLVGKDAAESKT
jgi:uncharacterized MnhB-related membrane protein